MSDALDRCVLLRDLPAKERARVAASARIRTLGPGQALFRRGDRGRDVFVVVTGTLEVLDDHDHVAAHARPGDLVGERSLLNGGHRNATIRSAARESQVAQLSATVVRRLFDEHPVVLRALAGMLAERTITRPAARPRTTSTIALIPAGGEDIAQRLLLALSASGPAALVDAARVDREVGTGASSALHGTPLAARVSTWLDGIEASHTSVLLVAGRNRRWTARCVRAADEVVLVAAGRRDGIAPITAGQRPFVALVRRGGAPVVGAATSWHDVAPPSRVLHADITSDADLARLARHVRGEAVGVVLGGGGARGLAHLGVLQALEDRGVPIDAVGGTSIGALMAGTVAAGWDQETRLAKTIVNLVKAKRLLGMTLPLVSFSSAGRLTRMLRSEGGFGERQIEDLPIPFFAISASLATGATVVHDHGPLWLATRASISLPGFLPPVPVDGDLLVDGGVVNNVPIDVMRDRGAGRVIASNLRGAPPRYPDAQYGPSLSGWRVLVGRLRRDPLRLPDPATTMLRAKELTAWAAHEDRLTGADLVIEPPVDGVDNLRFSAALPLVERAYEHTMRLLEGSGSDGWPSLDGDARREDEARRRHDEVVLDHG